MTAFWEPGLPPVSRRAPALGRETALVCSSAHGGASYPLCLTRRLRVPSSKLRKFEDGPIEQLLDGAARCGASVLWTDLPRAFVDANRHPQEMDPNQLWDGAEFDAARITAKARVGLGVAPSRMDDRPLYDPPLSAAEVRARVRLGHAPFHAALSEAMDLAHARHGIALLLDCHSMPSAAANADVALGDRHGRACDPALAELVKGHFERAGLSARMNAPFAGGWITERHGEPARGRHALQIELCRSLFLDERAMSPKPAMRELAALMTTLAETCIEHLRDFAPKKLNIA